MSWRNYKPKRNNITSIETAPDGGFPEIPTNKYVLTRKWENPAPGIRYWKVKCVKNVSDDFFVSASIISRVR